MTNHKEAYFALMAFAVVALVVILNFLVKELLKIYPDKNDGDDDISGNNDDWPDNTIPPAPISGRWFLHL